MSLLSTLRRLSAVIARCIPLVLGMAIVGGCGSSSEAAAEPDTVSSVMNEIPDSAWARLAQQRIFFGHQSVGFNILDGVRDVMATDPRLALRIVDSRTPESVEGPAIIHATIGENRRPDLKNDEFARIVERGFGDEGGVALFKYCYLDAMPSTDVRQLFEGYRRTVDSLQARYPRLRILQVTQPLFQAENPVASRLRLMLGKVSERALNAKRSEFNRLLLETYGPRGTVFDLARIESTRPDGTRERYTLAGDTVYALAPVYTDDGGHLNARGRRAVAEQFLAFLAKQSDGR